MALTVHDANELAEMLKPTIREVVAEEGKARSAAITKALEEHETHCAAAIARKNVSRFGWIVAGACVSGAITLIVVAIKDHWL